MISHDEGVLNDHELLLLCNLNRSNILDLPSDPLPDFNCDDLERTSARPNFASTNAICLALLAELYNRVYELINSKFKQNLP